jgi:hypothetical protein
VFQVYSGSDTVHAVWENEPFHFSSCLIRPTFNEKEILQRIRFYVTVGYYLLTTAVGYSGELNRFCIINSLQR